MGDATLYTVLPTHTAEAGIALAQVGIILSVNRVIRLFLNGPAGLAYDRWPRRAIFVVSLFVGAFSTALYAATRGFWPLLAGRLLWGLAWSGIWIGGAAILFDVTTDLDRGRWTGLYQTWFFLGSALGSFSGGALTDWIGYSNTMWIGSLVTAAGGFVALVLLPETRGAHKNSNPSQPEVHKNSRPIGRGVWIAASLQGINRLVIAGVLVATMALLVQEQLASIPLGLGIATLTGLLMAGRTLLSTVAAPLAGSLSDRLGDRWKITLAGLLLGSLSMFLLGWNNPFSILVGILLGAVASGGVQVLVTALAGDLALPGHRGRAIGILNTVGDLGSAIGPPLAYALLPWLGLGGIYLICAGMFLVGSGEVIWLSTHPGQADLSSF